MATQPLPSDAQIREFYDKKPDNFETARASHSSSKWTRGGRRDEEEGAAQARPC